MKDKLAIEVFYPHSPERVWQAITQSDSLSDWLMPATFEPVVGFQFVFEGLRPRTAAQWHPPATRCAEPERSVAVTGTVLEVEEGKRLVYTWNDGEDDSPGVVAWTLSPTDGGTMLRVEHEAAESESPMVLIEANMNWGYSLRHGLRGLLRRQPTPIVYVAEEPETDSEPKPRAGFRQETASCR